MTRLRWDVADRLSALHAAHGWASGTPGIDPALNAKIAAPLTRLSKRLVAAEVDLERFWSQLMAVAAAGTGDLEACQQALAAAGLGILTIDSTAAAIASGLAETRLAYHDRFPKAAGQLELRARPIRQQWDAYGPGLLRRIGQQTHESYLPKSVTGVMLTPYCGGAGDCSTATETFWMEAVLTNPVAAVPEVLRAAWLVTRIGIAQQLIPAATGFIANTGSVSNTGPPANPSSAASRGFPAGSGGAANPGGTAQPDALPVTGSAVDSGSAAGMGRPAGSSGLAAASAAISPSSAGVGPAAQQVRDRATAVIALAALPVTLDAAIYLELSAAATVDSPLIGAALNSWLPAESPLVLGGNVADLAETLANWWQQHQQLQPPFPVTLKALDRMLPGQPSFPLGATR